MIKQQPVADGGIGTGRDHHVDAVSEHAKSAAVDFCDPDGGRVIQFIDADLLGEKGLPAEAFEARDLLGTLALAGRGLERQQITRHLKWLSCSRVPKAASMPKLCGRGLACCCDVLPKARCNEANSCNVL